MLTPFRFSLLSVLVAVCSLPLHAQQAMDEAYAEKIRSYTTDPMYLNDMVDHLPLSDTVPSPLEYFGDIIGAPDTLHYTDEIYGYLRALAEASPRVWVRTIGTTEEGRDMIEVFVADEATIENLETYRGYLNRLADPRGLSEDEAQRLIEQAKPIYYFTAGLHSPETGPPEMVMELAYRLAVSDAPMIRNIRDHVITAFIPVTEPDGRDRVVDIYNYRAAHNEVTPRLIYWGKYVAHDNNRDGYGLGLALTRNTLDAYLYWKPTVMHDLHESVPYLYVSTGLGPYNEHIDPITVDEWHNLSFEEVGQLTRVGMPGVWTHGFYNGWAANYLIWMANARNSTGRFYETFGNSIPDTKERTLEARSTSREWYRSNPPLEKTMWSLRNNTNYMQSGVLSALNYTANHAGRFVENFYLKSKRSVERGRDEAPHAYVIPPEQRRTLGTVNLVNLLRRQGLDVHTADEALAWEDGEAPAGSYVVRLDQPYRPLARILLDKQNFPKGADPPYDDTGWTLPYLHQVEAHTVDDPEILSAPMTLLTDSVRVEGGLAGTGSAGFVLNNTTDDHVTVFRFELDDLPMHAAEDTFRVGEQAFAPGSLLLRADDLPRDAENRMRDAAEALGVTLRRLDAWPDVPTHEVEVPRVALVHTWVATPQNAGWWRLAFDKIGIPYTYLSEQDLATTDLSAFDVIILPDARTTPATLVSGVSMAGDPVPWKQTDAYRHIGIIDETDDMRKGMGYDGLQNLKTFIENGGVFLTEGATTAFPIDMGLTRRVSIKEAPNLVVRGSVLKADVTDKASPITYGFADTVAVYFSRMPVFEIDKETGDYRVPEWLQDEVWATEVPRPVVHFAEKNLLLSGMLTGESDLAGAPAVIDVPVGEGHVVLFANHPFWRWETHGSHALVFNTMLHWNDLDAGKPDRPEEDEDDPPTSPLQHAEGHY